jgi:hypothetical protein
MRPKSETFSPFSVTNDSPRPGTVIAQSAPGHKLTPLPNTFYVKHFFYLWERDIPLRIEENFYSFFNLADRETRYAQES